MSYRERESRLREKRKAARQLNANALHEQANIVRTLVFDNDESDLALAAESAFGFHGMNDGLRSIDDLDLLIWHFEYLSDLDAESE